MFKRIQILLILALLGSSFATLVSFDQASANPPANDPFERTWARTDKPVADGAVNRTWMWGPSANTESMFEPYAQSPGGEREVQYFDKTRMEINDPNADPNELWYVTNGLLATELITGRMQVGDEQFEDRQPANVQIAGDPDPNSPTYAMLNNLLDEPPLNPGEPVIQWLTADGQVQTDGGLEARGVTAAHYSELTDHTVASPFWDFMNSTGLVHENGQNVPDKLFENPFFATGLPITEAYWVHVPVAGEHRDVLAQCFERRCLTYTPGNPEGWQVEAANIGQHYYEWRQTEQSPSEATTSVEITDPFEPSVDTVIAEPETTESLSSASSDLTELRFSHTSSQVGELQAGNILVLDENVHTTEAAAVRILSVDSSGPEIIVGAEPVWLDEVFDSGGFSTSMSIPASSLEWGQAETVSWATVDPEGFIDWDRTFTRGFGDHIELKGELAFQGELEFDYDISWSRRGPGIDELEAAFATHEHARIEVVAERGVSYDNDYTLVTLPGPPIPIDFGVLGGLVTLNTEVFVRLGVDVNAEGSASAGFEYEGSHRAGLRYQNRSVSAISSSDISEDTGIFGPSIEAEANAKAWLELGIRATTFGAGPEIGVPVSTKIEADHNLDWSLGAAIDGRAAFRADFPLMDEFQYDVGEFNLWNSVLAEGSLYDLIDPDFSCDSVTHVPVSECNALVTLYQNTGGDSWHNNDGWAETGNPCNWYGVSCQNDAVRALDLSGNNLTGSLPVSLRDLSSLRQLYLGHNQLSGQFPSQIVHLGLLESFSIDNNSVGGTLPNNIGNLTNLSDLWIHNTNLEGRLPDSLINVPLSTFAFDGTDLCEPGDPGFQDWVGGISELTSTGVQCEATPADPTPADPAPYSFDISAGQSSLDVGETYTIGVTVFDQNNERLQGAEVTGQITGANSGWMTPNPAVTDNDGNAHLTYQGTSAGSDTITVSVSGIADTRTATTNWVETDDEFSCERTTNEELCEILVEFYWATGGDDWHNNDGWLEHEDLDMWFGTGYGCCPSPEFFGISLTNNNLTGEIPAVLGELDSHTRPVDIIIALRQNNLTGEVPTELTQISTLTNLDLSQNQLTGEIPDTVGNLSDLRILSINDNDFTGQLPLTLMDTALSEDPPDWVWYGTIFSFDETDLCEPSDPQFQSWLDGIDNLQRTGVLCDDNGGQQTQSAAAPSFDSANDSYSSFCGAWTEQTDWHQSVVSNLEEGTNIIAVAYDFQEACAEDANRLHVQNTLRKSTDIFADDGTPVTAEVTYQVEVADGTSNNTPVDFDFDLTFKLTGNEGSAMFDLPGGGSSNNLIFDASCNAADDTCSPGGSMSQGTHTETFEGSVSCTGVGPILGEDPPPAPDSCSLDSLETISGVSISPPPNEIGSGVVALEVSIIDYAITVS